MIQLKQEVRTLKKNRDVYDFIIWTVLAIAVGLVLSFSLLPMFGISSIDAMKIMISEIFSSSYSMGNILVKTAPLILTGLAFAFTYKAKLFNIGIQGQFYVGCITAAAISLKMQGHAPGLVVIILAALGSVAGGAFVGFMIGFFKAKFGANEFLVSMMSTYVFTYLNLFLMRTVLQESNHNYIKTDYLDKSVWLPQLILGTAVSWGIVFSILVAVLVWFVLYKTSLGYRIRMTGLNKEAAGMAGIKPERQFMISFAISGAIAGFAGWIEVNGMQHMMLPDFDAEIGSFGVGIAILANSHPIGILFAALLFGFLQVGGTALGHASGAPPSVIELMQGFVMLFVLMSFFFRRKIEINRLKKLKSENEEVA